MNSQSKSSIDVSDRVFRILTVGMLVLSILALAFAPRLMPSGYNWLRNTTSESAAQSTPGAWLGRLGFLLFGLAVLWLAARLKTKWTPPTRLLLGAFGVLMIATAAFSHKPWFPGLPVDKFEDSLHSFAATAMGFAFAIGVMLRLLERGQDRLGQIFDLVAVVAAVAIPLAMNSLPEWDGLLQRSMFGIAYVWYALEVLRGGEL
ncbi:MAG: DUF998 domain-containing protein [Anaerolineae bacterium]|jgi:hypothetical protein|nr:DUF998 domain-containing protein [Anaerolineae bacterium]